ncbi:hypothetical protein HPB47_021168 [Ixodes persulcatus]|uniref:Uncharacterized protein n=1 Tax=Ixodes persulcatus TaxID=34615 RepID=A0AC60QE99_IXOPE|nr:hypothetical protein HPB47_021168 [Ixodes persulcatus]
MLSSAEVRDEHSDHDDRQHDDLTTEAWDTATSNDHGLAPDGATSGVLDFQVLMQAAVRTAGDNDLLLCREGAAARRRPLQVRAQCVGEEHNARATESKALLQFGCSSSSNPSKVFKRSRNTRCRPIITTAYWANTGSLRCRRRVTVDIASFIFANPSANQFATGATNSATSQLPAQKKPSYVLGVDNATTTSVEPTPAASIVKEITPPTHLSAQ